MPAERFSIPRDHVSGFRMPGTPPWYAPAFVPVGSDGVEGLALAAGTDRSGTAQTTVAVLAAANAARRSLDVQNVGANNIGVTENGTDPTIGNPGTYTIAPGGSFKARTNREVRVIAATGATPYTATEA